MSPTASPTTAGGRTGIAEHAGLLITSASSWREFSARCWFGELAAGRFVVRAVRIGDASIGRRSQHGDVTRGVVRMSALRKLVARSQRPASTCKRHKCDTGILMLHAVSHLPSILNVFSNILVHVQLKQGNLPLLNAGSMLFGHCMTKYWSCHWEAEN